MLTLSVAFLVSFVVTLMVIRYSSLHAHITADWDLHGVQKFHARPVPRIGGLGIVLAMTAAAVAAWVRDPQVVGHPFLLLVVCVMPAFIAGFIEDMTKRVSPRERLLATMAAALVAVYLLNAKIVRIDIHLIDMALAIPLISIAITTVAVAGLANSINIIDGFNGLASMVAMMMFVSLAYVAFRVGDTLILTIAFAMIGAILGFFIWNFPAGHIFLGDGGAYMIGFVLAECSILLVLRNGSVSAWYPVLMVIYPIFETLFSIYRRRVLKGVPAGYPGWRASPYPDLPACHALGRGQQGRAASAAAQFDDVAVPLAAEPAGGAAGDAVLEQQDRPAGLCRDFHLLVRVAVLAHRPVPVAALADHKKTPSRKETP